MRARYDEGVGLQNEVPRHDLQLQDLHLQRAKADESMNTTIIVWQIR
jgi:hypothetical protein